MIFVALATLLGIGLVGTIGVLGGVPNTLSWFAYQIYRASRIQRLRSNQIASKLNEDWMRQLEDSVPEDLKHISFDSSNIEYLKDFCKK